jgi:two-component system NtrC family sensor kinase
LTESPLDPRFFWKVRPISATLLEAKPRCVTQAVLGWPEMKGPNSSSDYYRYLTRNIMVIVIVVSFAPLILFGGLVGYQFHTSYHDKVVAHLKELVERHKQNIDGFLYERLANVQMLVSAYTCAELTDEAFLQEKFSMLRAEYGGIFVDIGLVDEQGVQVAYVGPFSLRRAVYSEAEWFKAAVGKPVYISDVFLGLRGMPHFIIAVKKTCKDTEWIFRATIDFVAFNSLVEGTRIGKTGSAFILNKAGEFQTRPPSGPALDKGFYSRFVSGKRLEERGSKVEEVTESGRKLIYVTTPMKNGEWILVYQQDASDAFSDLYSARRLALVIFMVGGLGIVFMALVLSRRVVSRIARADLEKEMMNEQVIEAGKLASVGELAAGIAHEINNPVAIMVEEAGWIEDLLEEEDLRGGRNLEEFRRAVNQIKTQGKRCKEITHKLLSFARKTDPTAKEIQLNDLVEEIVGLSEQRARFSNVKIKTSLAPDLPTVLASPSEMQQVLLNLMNNALDAMEKTGGTLEITSRVEGDNVVLDVADTGVGIPKQNLARIFDPFFTTKAVGKGTGLGLSICYGIIKKMGGEISVNSAVGLGTTFHIRIPKATEREGRAKAQGDG